MVTLALVVDDAGIPIFSQIYGGNQSEPETLEDVLKRLKTDVDPELLDDQLMIVVDRGITTKDNPSLIKEIEFPYIVVELRAVEKEDEEELKHTKETLERLPTAK